MKLHLPVLLRSCIMALFAATATTQLAQASYNITSNTTYYSGHSQYANSLWDWTWGSTRVTSPGGISYTIKNPLQVKYWDIFSVTSVHNCVYNASGNCTASTTVTSGIAIDKNGDADGDGVRDDFIYYCSSENAPGMWIVSLAKHSTQEHPITFSNYNDMVIDGNRQQLVVKKAIQIDDAGNVTEWAYETVDLVDDQFIVSKDSGQVAVKELGMSLLVQDTNSFTYSNAYTGGTGSLGADGSHFHFNKVKALTFENNEAKGSNSGGLVGNNSFSFKIENADSATFKGNSGTAAIAYGYSSSDRSAVTFENIGTVTFEENKGANLFRSVDLTFRNVDSIVVNESESRLLNIYNGGSDQCRLIIEDCGSILVKNMNQPEKKGGFIYLDNYVAPMTIKNLGEFTYTDNIIATNIFYKHSGNENHVLSDIGKVNITNNTAISGELLSNRAMTFTNIGTSFSVTGNTMGNAETCEAESALSSANITVSGKYTTDTTGAITDKADLFEISKNKSYSKYGITYATINASYFDKADFSENAHWTKYYSDGHGLFSDMVFEHVDNLTINKNTVSASTNGMIYMIDELSASDFKTINITGNEMNVGGWGFGLWKKLTLSTEQEAATVTITGNSVISKSTPSSQSSSHIQTTKIDGVARFEVSKNLKELVEANQDGQNNLFGILGGIHAGNHSTTLTNIGSIILNENTTQNHCDNASGIYGGVIMNSLTVDKFTDFSITNNKAIADGDMSFVQGGAVCLDSADTTISNGSKFELKNTLSQAEAKVSGGAIYVTGEFNLKDLGDVVITGNQALAGEEGSVYGGAIYADRSVKTTRVTNITLSGNKATAGLKALGGAMYDICSNSFNMTISASGTIDICNNEAAVTYITGVAKGGGLFSDGSASITLTGAESLHITNNRAIALRADSAAGGAIYMDQGSLTISGNKGTLLQGNYIQNGADVTLQSIYANGTVNLEAKYQQTIDVHDSIVANTLNLNKTDMLGTITLTGATTYADLVAIKGEGNVTAAEIEASRLYKVKYVNVNDGDVYLQDGVHVEVTNSFKHNNGHLHIADASISSGHFNQAGGNMCLEYASISSKEDIITTDVEFFGCNELASGTYTSDEIKGTKWTFHLTGEHKKTAALTLSATEDGTAHISTIGTIELKSGTEKGLTPGMYQILTFNSDDFTWTEKNYAKTKLEGVCDAESIGTWEDSDVYFITDTTGTQYTLVYEIPLFVRTESAWLEWTASSGTWADGTGLYDELWSGEVIDKNYYNGDGVIFNSAAEVALDGYLTPYEVEVGNEEGTVAWKGRGQLTGAAKVTKTGAGTLEIHTANAYTGGTYIHEGTVKMHNAAALGLGNVMLNGGSLVNATRSASSITKGWVTLNGGSLSGDFTLKGSAGWNAKADTAIDGSLTLNQGSLTLHNTSLDITGALTLGTATIILDGTYSQGNSYTLISAGSITGNVGALTLQGVENYNLNIQGNDLVLVMNTPVTPDTPVIPDTPVTPDTPVIPDTPVTPDTPVIPDTPVTPDEPVIPDTPVTPDEPGIPDTPVTPDEPGDMEQLRPSGPVLVGGDIDKNTEVVLNGKGSITLDGKVNAGAITVDIEKNLTLKNSKKKPGSLTGDGDLTKDGKGTLTLNDGNGTWTGDTYLEAGTIKVKGTSSLGKGDVYLNGGTLNLSSKAISNDIIQDGTAAIKSGKKFTGTYTLESGELQKGSTINVTKTATLSGGTVNGTLSGTGKVLVDGNVKMGETGKITANNLTVEADAVLKTGSKGLSMGKSSNINMGEMALLHSYGKVSANNLSMNGSGFYAYESAKASSVSIKGNMSLKNGSVAAVKGKLTVGNLSMDDSRLYMDPNEATATVQKITVKGNTTLTNASELMTDKLTTGSLTLKDSTLTLTGSKPQSLTVKGALTINSGSAIILDYDYVQGKTYKVITCKTFSYSGSLYDLFGVSEEDCILERKGNAITLTVTGEWYQEFYTEEAEAAEQKAVATAATEQAAISTAAVETEPNPVADALVQSNWGQLEASRAFVNAMANRSMAVQLGNGERAVWASAIGSSSRHSSANGHNGADTNVSGGAFGLETQVGRASLFGMALGNSWTRVSAHGFGTIEQDTTHLGLYGQTNWRSGVTADWSAAYGRSDSETMGSDWSQKNVQLDGRVSYNHELNANTLLSPFAGLQYYASDSATVNGTSTGSLQNLRAEIGVAASRRMGKFGVYGEIALHQDLARNNPKVEMEGVRYNGMNPGRTGLNFTVGASYGLNDKWSVNASYTGEFVENANAHSANVGATYKF